MRIKPDGSRGWVDKLWIGREQMRELVFVKKKFMADRSASDEILLPWLKLRPNDIQAGKMGGRVG